MAESTTCTKCQKPKETSGAGIITQWIDVCRCDQLDIEQYRTVTVCSECGKQIASQKGSMTQWVFGAGRCECERPVPVEGVVGGPVGEDLQAPLEGATEADEDELEVDAGAFPIERYRPIAEVGRGSSGIVYLCRDRLLNKEVAVKTLKNLTREQLIAFHDEARATARLGHPGIVRVMDFGATESGVPYMVMEYVDGVSLDKYLLERGSLAGESVRSIFSTLASALQYAHERSVLHRDIKPSNIIIYNAENGADAKLIDFGVARVKEVTGLTTLYQEKALVGTPAYMAPDTIRGESYDERSEVYSLGCVLFECLTGNPPFIAETALEVLSLHANQPLPDLFDSAEKMPGIDRVVIRCLTKDKESRFASMIELGQALEVTGQSETPRAMPEGAQEKSIQIEERNSRARMLTGSLVGVIVLAYSVWFVWLNSNQRDTDRLSKSEAIEKQAEQVVRKVTPGRSRFLVTVRAGKDGGNLSPLVTRKDIRRLDFIDDDLRGPALSNLVDLSIEELSFERCQLDDQSFRLVGRMKKLLSLSVRDCLIATADLMHLREVSRLKSLDLRRTPIDENGLRQICQMYALEHLSLYGNAKLTSRSISLLRNLRNLKAIDLRGVNLSPENFQYLAQLESLREIRLTTISKSFIKEFRNKRLKRLVVQDFFGSNANDFLELSRFDTPLEYISIDWCPVVSSKVVKQFKVRNPGCKLELMSEYK